MYSQALLSAVAVLPLARGIAFGGPAPTATNADRAGEGWSPKPTKGPSVHELRRRQTNLYPETCGWVDGDYDSGITCNLGRTCMLYTASGIGMAGCCKGSDTQECGWANSCVDYDAYTAGSCDSDCELNTFVRKCSDSLSPYCVTWTYPGDSVSDYGCAAYSSATVETILQSAFDTYYSISTSMTLPTISGDAVTGWDGSSSTEPDSTTTTDADSTTDEEVFTTTETDGSVVEATSFPSSGGSSSKKGKKKVSVGLIAGAVVGGLVVLFVIVALIVFLCVKKKKSKQLAANQAAVAAAQANRPQSQYQQPQQPQMMQQQMPPPMPPQTPNAQYGYFAPNGQQDPQKINPQAQVHDYGMQSPISNPPTPAPAYVQPQYVQPHYANAPPMPTQSPGPYGGREPTAGAHEVDAVGTQHAPPPQGQHPPQQGQITPQGGPGPIYEIGQGR